jgi:hypothetical protein
LLLIIFMVTAPLIQRGIDVKLPVARRSAQVIGERVEITIPGTFRQSRVVFIGKEQVRAGCFRSASASRWSRARKESAARRRTCSIRIDDIIDMLSAGVGTSACADAPAVSAAPRSTDTDVSDVLRDHADPAGCGGCPPSRWRALALTAALLRHARGC